MARQHKIKKMSAAKWREVLMGTHPGLYFQRRLFQYIPADPRCRLCNAPFGGIGGRIMPLLGRAQYDKNPLFCEACLTEPVEGVEVEINMLFADVRGSTGLAEKMSASEFAALMNRFYDTARGILSQSLAVLDKFVGDEVIGLYIPGFAGAEHARKAIQAARDLLTSTGQETDQPWLNLVAGVHTGNAYIGLSGSQGGVGDFTALGDSMNITARLAAQAGPGEILVSQAAYRKAGLKGSEEVRTLALKGRSEPIRAHVLKVPGD